MNNLAKKILFRYNVCIFDDILECVGFDKPESKKNVGKHKKENKFINYFFLIFTVRKTRVLKQKMHKNNGLEF